MKQKIKIMEHKPQPSDEEIRSYMNFDRLLDNRKVALSSAKALSVLKWSVFILVITVPAAWILLQKDSGSERVVEKNHKQSDAIQHFENSPPAAGDTSNGEGQIQFVPPSGKAKSKEARINKLKGEHPATLKEDAVISTGEPGYVQAEPLAGYSDLYNFFSRHMKYPAEGLKDSIQGVQTISFVINPAGKPEQITVVNSLGEPFDKEAKRLIENMPAWKPALLDGKPVASKISIPITFQIQKIKN